MGGGSEGIDYDFLSSTIFTFVNDGIESALKQAFADANGTYVRLAGGILEGLGGVEDLFKSVEFSPSEAVSHLRLVRKT